MTEKNIEARTKIAKSYLDRKLRGCIHEAGFSDKFWADGQIPRFNFSLEDYQTYIEQAIECGFDVSEYDRQMKGTLNSNSEEIKRILTDFPGKLTELVKQYLKE